MANLHSLPDDLIVLYLATQYLYTYPTIPRILPRSQACFIATRDRSTRLLFCYIPTGSGERHTYRTPASVTNRTPPLRSVPEDCIYPIPIFGSYHQTYRGGFRSGACADCIQYLTVLLRYHQISISKCNSLVAFPPDHSILTGSSLRSLRFSPTGQERIEDSRYGRVHVTLDGLLP